MLPRKTDEEKWLSGGNFLTSGCVVSVEEKQNKAKRHKTLNTEDYEKKWS